MINNKFLKVTELDKEINKVCEAGNYELEEKLYEEQNKILEEIENEGLRDEFDDYIASIN